MLGKLADALAALPDWNHDACDAALRSVAAAEGVKAGLLINATRVAIVGRAVAPPLFETMVVLGKDRVISRLRRAVPLVAALILAVTSAGLLGAEVENTSGWTARAAAPAAAIFNWTLTGTFTGGRQAALLHA